MARIDDPVTTISWRSGWFCLTINDRLASDGRHVTVDLPELSVTVQNFRGGLRGFWNVCAHRGTQMRHAGCGVGPLRCPYHGWVYNGEGVPVGIPDNELLFALDGAARRALALRPIEVASHGRLVFVRVDPGTETLVEALGARAARLAAIPDPSDDLRENEGFTAQPAPEIAAYRNLRIRGGDAGSSIEITLPEGRHGTAVTRFDFIARSHR